MDFSEIFRIVNLVVGVALVLGGVSQLLQIHSPKEIIVAVYLFVFGASTALLEFQIPPQVSRYASFMFSFVGRGILYLFFGVLIFGSSWYQWIPGTIVTVVGVGYIALEFVPSIEPPANMRDAEQGWGAEQV